MAFLDFKKGGRKKPLDNCKREDSDCMNHLNRASENLSNLLKKAKMQILYAEDDEQTRSMIMEFFHELDSRPISIVKTVSQLGSKVEIMNPSFIFADVALCGQNAIEEIYARFKEGYVKCPVFFYSEKAITPQEKNMLIEMKAQFYSKPLVARDMKNILLTILKKTR